MSSDRKLWVAVVQQALDDLRDEQFDSTWYNQAVAFLIGGGYWREGRANIADLLGVDPTAFDAFGRKMVNEDRARRGQPPIRVTPKPTPTAKAAPLPRLEAVKAPVVDRRTQRNAALRARRAHWATYNPFDPRWRLPNRDMVDKLSDAAD